MELSSGMEETPESVPAIKRFALIINRQLLNCRDRGSEIAPVAFQGVRSGIQGPFPK
jgi:hypothetical protein